MLPLHHAVAAPRITIVVRKVSDSAMEKFETQLRAELLTMGFEVLTLPDPPSTVDPDSLEAIAERTQAIAAIIIDQPEGNVSGRLWLTERVTGKTIFRKVRPEKMSAEAPTIFALRAVELLRASLLELQEAHPTRGTVEATAQLRQMVAPTSSAVPVASQPSPAKQPAPPTPTVAPTPAPAPPTRSGEPRAPHAPLARPVWSASAGLRTLAGTGGMPWTVGPSLGVGWHLKQELALLLQGSGPFTGRVEEAGASAVTSQLMVELRVRRALLSVERTLVPYLAVGAGLHRMTASGAAVAPSRGVENSASSVFISGTAGVALRAGRSLRVLLEADVALTASKQKLLFGEDAVATVGRPLVAGAAAGEVSW